MKTAQVEMVSTESLVGKEHVYRKMKTLLNFDALVAVSGKKDEKQGAYGYTVKRLVLCLLLQFIEDLSDREMERFLKENIAGKWFCDFNITEKTPDHTTFCKFRNVLGSEKIEKIFEEHRRQLKAKGYLQEDFTFIDATALISKLSLWEERDKAIADGYEKLNNENIGKYTKDKEATIGAKSDTKFWLGYKKHVAVEMKTGLIDKVKVTKANVPDAKGLDFVCPQKGMVFADKGYVPAIEAIKKQGCIPMVILKNNMKEKDKQRDAEISKRRSPHEGTFSKQNKRTRYMGVVKNQVSEFLYAVGYNLKKMIRIEERVFKN